MGMAINSPRPITTWPILATVVLDGFLRSVFTTIATASCLPISVASCNPIRSVSKAMLRISIGMSGTIGQIELIRRDS